MPAFAIKTTEQISDWLIPVNTEMARQLVALARTRDDKTGVMAVYYLSGNRDKPRRESILVMVQLYENDDLLGYVITGDYHPRSQGRAHLVFKTETYVHD